MCNTLCFVSLALPVTTPINIVYIISYSINATSSATFANVNDLYLNWSIPDPPTGDKNDLVYEIRIADNMIIPNTTETYVLMHNSDASVDQVSSTGMSVYYCHYNIIYCSRFKQEVLIL